MKFTIFKVFFFGVFLSEVLGTKNLRDNTTSLLKKCPENQCLTEAIVCLSGSKPRGKGNSVRCFSESCQVEKLKGLLQKAGKPNGFALLDSTGHLPQKLLVAGYDKYSMYDLGWQALHMAAAAACRGSTSSGGTGCCANVVLVRNRADRKSCTQICGQTLYKNCDAEVSIHGKTGKATKAGEMIGAFYNYSCSQSSNGGSEVSSSPTDINRFPKGHTYYSFCCCRK
ncbi:hypothetical protein pdam_00024590 [Pocillopora damicornis]|uniref:Uncharacterized protein n=1 Tax=Pocillopora damicornis TaxID=46731 RepID=A0A3M6TCP0_POCDA|nr:hypothetical protein pdam_00024590 [Pocillopora damicornis]